MSKCKRKKEGSMPTHHVRGNETCLIYKSAEITFAIRWAFFSLSHSRRNPSMKGWIFYTLDDMHAVPIGVITHPVHRSVSVCRPDPPQRAKRASNGARFRSLRFRSVENKSRRILTSYQTFFNTAIESLDAFIRVSNEFVSVSQDLCRHRCSIKPLHTLWNEPPALCRCSPEWGSSRGILNYHSFYAHVGNVMFPHCCQVQAEERNSKKKKTSRCHPTYRVMLPVHQMIDKIKALNACVDSELDSCNALISSLQKSKIARVHIN